MSSIRVTTWIVIIMSLMLLPLAAACSRTATGPMTFKVEAGAEDTAQGLEVNAFLPGNLTIDVGDTIEFRIESHEPHTITFNAPSPLPDAFLVDADGRLLANPEVFLASATVTGTPASSGVSARLAAQFDGAAYVNSGVLQNPGDTFSVTFTKAGSYAYTCLLHPDIMKGTITVNSAGTSYTKMQKDYDKEAAVSLAKHKTDAKVFFDSINVPAPATASDGTRTFTVFAGAMDDVHGNDFMHFFGGENLTIKVGDKVTWSVEKNGPGTPHTITFLSGGSEPDLIAPELQPSGPPKLVLNPKVVEPSPLPPAPYSGTGYYNSGLIIKGGPMPQTYTLTFTKAGTYAYICILHNDDGMKGTITVSPSGGQGY